MKKTMVCFIAIVTHGVLALGNASASPSNTIREDIKLLLTIPDYPLLQSEYEVPCMLRVTNTGDAPVPFCTHNIIGTQLKFDLGMPGYKPVYDSVNVTNTLPWGKHVSLIADIIINPKESYELDLTWQFYPVQEACAFIGATNITAYLLVGENEWAKSDPTHIVVKGHGTYEAYWKRPPVFTARKEGREIMNFFTYSIDGKKYLFDSRRKRVCEIQGDELSEFLFDEKTEILSVSQPNRKRIHYNLITRKNEHDGIPH